MAQHKMRCLACGLANDLDLSGCPCGADLTIIQPIAAARPIASPPGHFRRSILLIAAVLSFIQCITALAFALYIFTEKLDVVSLFLGLVALPLSAIYSLALCYVFATVAEISPGRR